MVMKLTKLRLVILNLLFLGISILLVILSYFIFPVNPFLNPLYIIGIIFLSLWIGTGVLFLLWIFCYEEKAERTRYTKYLRNPKEIYLPNDIESTNFASFDENEVLKETNEPKCPYCGAILIDNPLVCDSCKTRIVKDSEI